MTVVSRPPLTSDERTQLTGWLDVQRSFVRMKCEGLSEAEAHRKLLPTSPLMTMAGIVAHLRWVEYSWFHLNLAGVPDTGQTPWTEDGHVDAEMFVDDVEKAIVRDSGAASTRYILCHMIEETARHVGHLDIIRELLDGHRSYNE